MLNCIKIFCWMIIIIIIIIITIMIYGESNKIYTNTSLPIIHHIQHYFFTLSIIFFYTKCSISFILKWLYSLLVNGIFLYYILYFVYASINYNFHAKSLFPCFMIFFSFVNNKKVIHIKLSKHLMSINAKQSTCKKKN